MVQHSVLLQPLKKLRVGFIKRGKFGRGFPPNDHRGYPLEQKMVQTVHVQMWKMFTPNHFARGKCSTTCGISPRGYPQLHEQRKEPLSIICSITYGCLIGLLMI